MPVEQQIQEFIIRFIPFNLKHPDPHQNVTPHSLLYDFLGHFPQVQFTCLQLKDCLQAYLDLLGPVQQFVTNPDHYFRGPIDAIYTLNHMDASELLLAYFRRTPKDAHYPDLSQFVHDSRAAEQVERFLAVVEPSGSYSGDGTKRIFTILHVLKELSTDIN